MLPLCCSRRAKVTRVGADVEDKCLLPRIDIWMNQSFGVYVFSEIDAKSGCLRVSVRTEDV